MQNRYPDNKQYSFDVHWDSSKDDHFADRKAYDVSDGGHPVIFEPGTGTMLFNYDPDGNDSARIPLEIRLRNDAAEDLVDKMFNRLTVAGTEELLPKSQETCVLAFQSVLSKLTKTDSVKSFSFADRNGLSVSVVFPSEGSGRNPLMYFSHADGNRDGERNLLLMDKEKDWLKSLLPNRLEPDYVPLVSAVRKIMIHRTPDGRYPQSSKIKEIFTQIRNPEINRAESTDTRLSCGLGDVQISVAAKSPGNMMLTVNDTCDVFGKNRKVTRFISAKDNRYLENALDLYRTELARPKMKQNEKENMDAIKEAFSFGAERAFTESRVLGLMANGKRFILDCNQNTIRFDSGITMNLDGNETRNLWNMIATDPASAYERMLNHEISDVLSKDKSVSWRKAENENPLFRNSMKNPGTDLWYGESTNVFNEKRGFLVFRIGDKIYQGKSIGKERMQFSVSDKLNIVNGRISEGKDTFKAMMSFTNMVQMAEKNQESLVRILKTDEDWTRNHFRRT